MRKTYAYAFRSDLQLPEVLARLNEVGPWSWIERDNDRWGEYISALALPDPHRGTVKIIVEPDHYVVNVLLTSQDPDAEALFESVRETLFDRLLPAIGATGLARTDTYE
jgi:hypothetical protein